MADGITEVMPAEGERLVGRAPKDGEDELIDKDFRQENRPGGAVPKPDGLPAIELIPDGAPEGKSRELEPHVSKVAPGPGSSTPDVNQGEFGKTPAGQPRRQ